jgi:glycosyltransferase involved in cell wall biosynthesis
MNDVSIVIPAGKRDFNKLPPLLKLLIDNNKSQEIILVLNGVANNCLKDIQTGFPSVKVIYKPRMMNPAVARNLGAHRATGDYILFVDADCLLDEHYFKILKSKIPERRDVIVGAVKACSPRSDLEKCEAVEHDDAFRKYVFSENGRMLARTLVGANFLIRREIFRDIGGFNGYLESAEDRELGARLYTKGYQIEYYPQLVVYHQFHRSYTRTLKRHLWHARGNSKVYKMYPGIFNNPIKGRLKFLKNVVLIYKSKQIGFKAALFYIILSLLYIVIFKVSPNGSGCEYCRDSAAPGR